MKKVLFIGKVLPESISSAAGTRMMQLLDFFRKQHSKITFVTPAGPSEFADDLPALGIDLEYIAVNESSFDDFIMKLQPQIVIFDRFTSEEQFGWRVTTQCPDALRVLDTEDLHCLRAARQLALKDHREFKKEDLFSEIAKREIASIYRSDLSLIISEFEMNLLQEVFKVDKDLLFYLPLWVEENFATVKKNWRVFEDRNHFISLGNFLHEPNWDAVQYLKKEIWPLIRKALPGAQLHVYGAYPTNKVYALDSPKTGFLIKGRADSVNEVMLAARVCLAPIRIGAGLKGKLLDAMVCGLPNVTTSIGAEGMQGEMDWPGSITDDPKQFAEQAVKLYQDKATWEKAPEHGVRIIEKRFQRKEFEGPFIQHLKKLSENMDQHRLQNFTGAMLMQHTTQSTKYMSMWIETKNRIKSQ